MKKIITAGLGVLALTGAGIASASADPTEEPIYAQAAWEATDTALDGTRTPSAESAIVDESTVEVTWAADAPSSAGGSSVESTNLNAVVAAGDDITVSYEMSNGAVPAGGAARLFVYYRPNANTVSEAPDAFVWADVTSGTLTIEAGQAGTIGTIGVVYDSSGSTPGTVTFSDLTVAGKAVSFLPAPVAVTPEAPTVTQPTCEALTATLSVPDVEGVEYSHESGPVEAGTLEVTAVALDGYVIADGAETSWTLTVNAPPTDCDPGSEDGTDDGAEDGADAGAEAGDDDGAEDGADAGADAGTESGAESGDDDGAASGADDGDDDGAASGADDGDDDGDSLPDTGASTMLLTLAALTLLAGGVGVLVARRRTVQ